ncbi:MAG: F0F1 ATP synthase subunit delta [Porticoccaceae bacterium]|nr:F0F1 ATP synthase subunit delta [Porticoccaceae bacterium]
MAELSTLARPYAKAVFEYAQASGNLEQWSAVLAVLSAVVSEATMQKLLGSPELTTQQQAATLSDVCAESLDDKGRNLVQLLAENRRLQLLPFIREQFDALKLQRQQSVDVELISAQPLDQGQQDKLAQALARKLERSINITTSVDESLLGGVLIRAGDTVIDGSIRGRLTKLAEALNA